MHNIEKERYERARKKVEEIKGFYIHLAIYILVNMFIVGAGLLNGAGLVAHAIEVFAVSTGWEERKIRELMAKEAGQDKAKNDYFHHEKS